MTPNKEPSDGAYALIGCGLIILSGAVTIVIAAAALGLAINVFKHLAGG